MANILWKFIESLPNNFPFKGRNSANSANIDLFKLDSSDLLQFLRHPYLPGNPTANLQAATKQYVDGAVSGLSFPLSGTIIVAKNGNDTSGDGSLQKPYLTIQKAIDSAAFGDTIIVYGGEYIENLVINNKDHLTIIGVTALFDSFVTRLSGTITVSGTSTRFRMRDINIAATSNSDVPLTINGTNGRHFFWNVDLNKPSGVSKRVMDVIGNPSNWIEFADSSINGEVYLGGTPSPLVRLGLYRSKLPTTQIVVDHANYVVTAYDCPALGKLTHNAGTIVLSNIAGIAAESGECIVSSAPLAATNALFLRQVNLQQADLSFGKINKTGNCAYVLDGVQRNASIDVLTGTRVSLGYDSVDILYKPATPADWTILPTSTKDAIDKLAANGRYKSEQRTLTSGEITAKQLTLAHTPKNPSEVVALLIGGSPLDHGADYTVSGATVNWSGLGLDGLIAAGDKIIFIYMY